MELQRKIQVNFILLIVCLCILSSVTTYIIVKSEPTMTQSQNVYINKPDSKQKTNINTASVEELKALPSIDIKKANLIINNRPFNNIYDIVKIKGIGNDTMTKIETLITVKE